MAKKSTAIQDRRLALIKNLEKVLGPGTRVITYVNGARSFLGQGTGPGTRIGQDAVRLMYDHLAGNEGRCEARLLKVALFLISNGGDTAVPWRIISMIREFAHGSMFLCHTTP